MKEENIEKMKSQIDSWSAEIDLMEAELNKVSADTRLKYQEGLNDLKARRDRVVERYEELREASGDSVDLLKQGVVAAWQDLAESIRHAKNTFKGF